MFNFNKKSEAVEVAAVSTVTGLDLAGVLAAVSVAPAHPRVVYHFTEDAGQFPAPELVRRAAIWAERNATALAYEGDSVETLKAEEDALAADIAVHNVTILRLRAELIRVTGGHEAAMAAAAAHIDLPFDPALISGQHAATNEIHRLGVLRKGVQARMALAMAHDKAKSELVSTMVALLGNLR